MALFDDMKEAAVKFDRANMPDRALSCVEHMMGIDEARAYSFLRRLRAKWARLSRESAAAAKDYMKYVRRLYILGARVSYEDYLIAVEFDTPYENKFYLPRREYLTRIGLVAGYQDILDGKLDLLTISLPKRAGKSQSGINFVTMLSGRYPYRASLMEGTGDDLVDSFYKGCLQYVSNDNGYLFSEIFPNSGLERTKADTHIIDLGEQSRFPTIMCRSIDARQVGLSEATNVLYLDDCVEGREEAKNRNRMDAKWEVINGDVLGRAIEGTPVVATGTRYSIYDPIGRLQERFKELHKRVKTIEVPALDLVTDESNYEYFNPKLGRKVFTTEYFRNERKSLSEEQFESEFQQQPFEAKGLLFPAEGLNRYFELPSEHDPDYVYAACDTAEDGADYTAMVVASIYGDDVYIQDVVYDNSPPDVTKPECSKKLVDNKVGAALFESNGAGAYFARDVEEAAKKMGAHCSVTTKRTLTNKRTRIELASDNIKKHFYFLDESLYKPNSQYAQALRELTTYTRLGKVPHDDFTDVLSLLENAIRDTIGVSVEIVRRPF